MKKVEIRVLFPYGWYDLRSLKIMDADGNIIRKISPSSICLIETVSDINIKLDWYNTRINYADLEINEKGLSYVLIKFGGENSFYGLEYLSPKALNYKLVKEKEFYECTIESEYAKSVSRSTKSVDGFFVIGSSIVSCLLLAFNFLLKTPFRNFNMICITIAVIGLAIIYMDRGKMSINQFRLRSVSIVGVLAIGTYYSDTIFVGIEFKWVFYLVLFTCLLRGGGATRSS